MISSAINLGRTRGEIESSTKALVSVKGGHRDPAKAGFWEISEAADRLARAVCFANAKAKDGRLVKGVPDDRWAASIAADPLKALDPETLHVFLPETRDVQIRGGCVFAVVGGQTLAWREPELFAHTGNGYAVTIKFDPAEPTLGCAIFNRETGTRNRDGWALGLFLGLADHEPDAPQICAQRGFRTEVEVESLARRKRYTSAIRAEYRGIVGRDAPPVRASEARNGRGEIVRIEEGRGDKVTRGGGDKSSGHRATVSPGHLEDRGLAQPRPRAAATRDRMMELILGG